MTCRCTLHPRKTHTDPCRACQGKHVRLARSVDVLGAPRLSEGPEPGRRTRPEVRASAVGSRLYPDPATSGTSPDPALPREPRRARRVHAGSSRQSGQGVASLIPPAIRPAPTAGD